MLRKFDHRAIESHNIVNGVETRAIQEKILRKLMNMYPPKWGASHTDEKNLVKGLPKHLRGLRTTRDAIDDLYRRDFLLRTKKTGEWHVSLNPRKHEEISAFLNI